MGTKDYSNTKLQGLIMFVTIAAEEDWSHLDPIAFLLNNERHVNNGNDILFYKILKRNVVGNIVEEKMRLALVMIMLW